MSKKYVDAIECLARQAGYKISDDGQSITIFYDNDLTEVFKDLISHFNQVAGTSYKHDSKDYQAKVRGLLKAGYEIPQIKETITHRVNLWKNDAEMSQYCRPSTILRLSKFENYYQEMFKANKSDLLTLLKDDWNE